MLALACAPSCSGEPHADPPCEDVRAADVCYSDEFAGPSAETAQEAIDEIAVRAVPDGPLADRIYVTRFANMGPPPVGNFGPNCFPGDLLLGGSCVYVEPEPRDLARQPIM